MIRTLKPNQRCVVGITLAALLAFAVPGQATELSLFKSFYGVGYASAGIGAIRGVNPSIGGTIQLTGIPAGATISNAYLYIHGHSVQSQPSASTTAAFIFAGRTVRAAPSVGYSAPDGWQAPPFNLNYGQAFRADVSTFVTGNGNYSVQQYNPFGTNFQGASLIVIYSDPTHANDRDVMIFDGCDSNQPNPYDRDGWNTTLPGITYAGSPVSLELHVSDGQSFYQDGAMMLNGQPWIAAGNIWNGALGANANNGFDANFFTGSLWDIQSYDISSFLTTGANTLTLTSPTPATGVAGAGQGDDDLTLVAAVVNMPHTGSPPPPPPPPPPNQPPVVSCSGAVTVGCAPAAGVSTSVTASVSDPDGDALTVTWTVNGSTVAAVSLAAGTTTTTMPVTLNYLFLPGTNTVTAAVSDGTTTVNCTTTVTVNADTTPPTVTCPGNISVMADATGHAAVPDLTTQVIATDDCTATSALVLTQSPAAGTLVVVGTTTITVSATDAAGNTGACATSFLVSAPPPIGNFTSFAFYTNCFTTFTQGGWGATPSGSNPGAFLAAAFAFVYPNGVVVGGQNSLEFTSAGAIEAFLPQGGTAAALKQSAVDPTGKISVFAGQVLALELSVDFSNAGLTKKGLASLTLASGPLQGMSVGAVLALANQVLGGNLGALPRCVSISDLNNVVTALNQNFDNGTSNGGYVNVPAGANQGCTCSGGGSSSGGSSGGGSGDDSHGKKIRNREDSSGGSHDGSDSGKSGSDSHSGGSKHQDDSEDHSDDGSSSDHGSNHDGGSNDGHDGSSNDSGFKGWGHD